MKLWESWKKKVDEHNEKQTYVTYEECWSYYTIFTPIIFALAVFFVLIFNGMDIVGTSVTSIATFIIFGVFLYANWRAYD